MDAGISELQVWRNIGNDVYQKINGNLTSSRNHIYEYSNFSPICTMHSCLPFLLKINPITDITKGICAYNYVVPYEGRIA